MIFGRAVETIVWSSAGRKSVRNMLPTRIMWRTLDRPWRDDDGSSSFGGSWAVRVPLVLSESV